MSSGYKIRNQQAVHFVTFAVVEWVDVFTRREYAYLVVDSLNYCHREKGLLIHAWCLMPNHLHLILSVKESSELSAVIRDFKKFTSSRIIKAIEENPQESRRNWMLWIFRAAGEKNKKNEKYQFWRQDNQPKELVSNAFKDEKLQYVHQNPVEAGLVREAEHYPYTSVVDYAGGKGLVEVSFL
jgi:REP element-mobilizing transposase RayT